MTEKRNPGFEADEIVTALSTGLENVTALAESIEDDLNDIVKFKLIPDWLKPNLNHAIQLLEILYVVVNVANDAYKKWESVFQKLIGKE